MSTYQSTHTGLQIDCAVDNVSTKQDKLTAANAGNGVQITDSGTIQISTNIDSNQFEYDYDGKLKAKTAGLADALRDDMAAEMKTTLKISELSDASNYYNKTTVDTELNKKQTKLPDTTGQDGKSLVVDTSVTGGYTYKVLGIVDDVKVANTSIVNPTTGIASLQLGDTLVLDSEGKLGTNAVNIPTKADVDNLKLEVEKPGTGLLDRVTNIKTDVESMKSSVDGLKTLVGSDSEGLVKAYNDIKSGDQKVGYASKADKDADGNDIKTTYQKVADRVGVLDSEGSVSKYPSEKAVVDALKLKATRIIAGDGIKITTGPTEDIVKVEFDTETIGTSSEGLNVIDVNLATLAAQGWTLSDIIPVVGTTLEQSILITETKTNEKIVSSSGTFRGAYDSLALLQAAFPAGTHGTYDVIANNDYAYVGESDSEGNWMAKYKAICTKSSTEPVEYTLVRWEREYRFKVNAFGTTENNALQSGITSSKVTAYDNHINNTTTNPHNVTKSDVGLSNVENKSVATIKNEILTKSNIEALDFQTKTASDAKYKNKQAPVNSPATSGNTLEFIDTISQDSEGVILATKKGIPTVVATGTSGETDGLMTKDQAKQLVDSITKLAEVDARATKVAPSSNNGYIWISNSEEKVYVHPEALGSTVTEGFYKFAIDNKEGHISSTTAVAHNDIIGVMNAASASDNGYMTSAQASKLDNVKAGATKVEKSSNNGYIKINDSEAKVYGLPTMSATMKGGAKLGTGLEMDSTDTDTLKLKPAGQQSLGGVQGTKDGNGIAIDGNGFITVDVDTMPTATSEDYGVVKVDGITITIDGDGKLKGSAGTKVDGNTVTDIKTSTGNPYSETNRLATLADVSAATAGVASLGGKSGAISLDSSMTIDSANKLIINNVSTSYAGLAPQAPNDTTKFLRGDGTWATAPGKTYTASTGLNLASNAFSLKSASASEIGGIKLDSATSTKVLQGDGTWVNQSSYTLPTASATTLGGVKVGTNLSISSGVLSATDTTYTASTGLNLASNAFSLKSASASEIGGIKLDSATSTKFLKGDGTWAEAGKTYTAGTGLNLASNAFSLKSASASEIGGIKLDSTTSTKFLKGDGTWAEAGKTYTASKGVTIDTSNDIQLADAALADGISVASGAIKAEVDEDKGIKIDGTTKKIVHKRDMNSDTAQSAPVAQVGSAAAVAPDTKITTSASNVTFQYDEQGHINGKMFARANYGTLTLPSGSTGTVTISAPAEMGITADDHPVLDVLVSNTSTATDELTAWSKVVKAETGAGTITFTLTDATATAITVQIRN